MAAPDTLLRHPPKCGCATTASGKAACMVRLKADVLLAACPVLHPEALTCVELNVPWTRCLAAKLCWGCCTRWRCMHEVQQLDGSSADAAMPAMTPRKPHSDHNVELSMH